jgi:CheY-like chemotaxis protein
MNIGPYQPSGGNPGEGGRRRRRRGRGGAQQRPGHPGGQPHHGGGGGGRGRGGILTGPMDHSYRNGSGNGQASSGRMSRGRPQPVPKFFQHPDVEPLPDSQSHETKIYCFVDDLFFSAKIQEVARKLNIKVEFVKTDKDMFEKLELNGNGTKPSLIIFDLNNANAKPLSTIPKLKKMLKKETAIIGFLSHLQAELKGKAQDAGCDMVLPRSAFSQNLPQLLRRHAAGDEADVQ